MTKIIPDYWWKKIQRQIFHLLPETEKVCDNYTFAHKTCPAYIKPDMGRSNSQELTPMDCSIC